MFQPITYQGEQRDTVTGPSMFNKLKGHQAQTDVHSSTKDSRGQPYA
jgi:hypothetical protein